MHRPLLLRCGLIAALLISALGLRAEEPFNFDQTPGRLPKNLLPQRYTVRIEPSNDLTTFTGSEKVTLEAKSPFREIVLNAIGLEITDAMLKAEGPVSLQPTVDAEKQVVTFSLNKEFPAGRYELILHFTGKIDERARGLYRVRYQAGGKEQPALATQMEATDARRMFPCWDEPAFRAEFELTAVVPDHFRAVSNMPVVAEKALGDGRREVAFAPTPKMASYLVALAASEFEELHDEVDGIKLGIYVTPGRREQARYALEATKQILHYYNEYFGLKFPLPKLDQIAFPSTGAGGMENWGCIHYTDSALLYDPATSAQVTKQRVYGVVAHEIAHQWFGDLVTMAWWDNLWLNEGFASWMGTKASDHFNPEWKVWLRAAGSKEWAMHLDARATTHPIQQPIANEAQAADAFDEITYNKGEAVLRMLENWLGEDAFRDGVRAYLKAHAYSNSTTADLWQALEDVSGKPVRAFAAGWTEQPGFPVVTVSAMPLGSGAAVQFEQSRFTIHQKDPEPLLWQIPVNYGTAGNPQNALTLLLKNRVQPGTNVETEAAIKANIGDVGYYRTAYDPILLKRLRKAAVHLAETDQLNLLNDTWALAQAGRSSATDYLDLATALSDDPSDTILNQIISVIGAIDNLERGTPQRTAFRAWACGFLRPYFDRLGWDAKTGESPLDTELRSTLIGTLGYFEDPNIVREAQARFTTFLATPASLSGDLRRTVLTIVGRNADEATWEKLHELGQHEESSEHKSEFYSALATARDPALAKRTLALSLTDELTAWNAASLVGKVAHSGEQPELAWEFARTHLDALLSRLPAIAANNYVPGIFSAFDEAARADELETFARENLPPAVAHSVARVTDDIRFHAEFKSRALPEIDAWWQARVQR